MLTRSLAALTVIALSTLTACSGDDDGDTATDPAASSGGLTSGVSCDYTTTGQAAKDVEPPPSEASRSGEVDVTIATGVGDLQATLDASPGPGVLTEVRPGVYVFGDAQQWELGTCSPDEIALTCRATVVSHAGGRLVLDAGSKALGADRAAYATGYGRLPDHPDARVVLLSEHHAVADLGTTPLPSIGSQVDVVPNHVCNAVNLAETLYVDDNGELRMWPVLARGQNS
jgi:D-serine deaminase-like pyridoxal phosphate-dependent protein